MGSCRVPEKRLWIVLRAKRGQIVVNCVADCGHEMVVGSRWHLATTRSCKDNFRIARHSPGIVLSGDNLRCPVLGTEKNSMVLPRRIQLEDAQCRPVETGSQLGHGGRKNNFVDLDGAK